MPNEDGVAEEQGGQAGKQKKGGSPLIIILMLVNMLLVAGVGAYLVLFSGANKAADGQVEGEDPTKDTEEKSEAVKAKTVGPLVELDPFLVNLDEPGTNRYLKAMIQVEMKEAAGVEEVKSRMVQLRDLVITHLSSLNYNQTQGAVNKEIIRSTLIKKINGSLSSGEVKNLYFTEFVIQ